MAAMHCQSLSGEREREREREGGREGEREGERGREETITVNPMTSLRLFAVFSYWLERERERMQPIIVLHKAVLLIWGCPQLHSAAALS